MKQLDYKMKVAQLKKVDAEIAKLIAETSKINREARWYFLIATTGILAAAAAIINALTK